MPLPMASSATSRLRGSVTGDDGEGYSTNRFVSRSGRVVIEPEDWNLAYSVGVFKRPLPENHIATWRAVLRGPTMLRPQAPRLASRLVSLWRKAFRPESIPLNCGAPIWPTKSRHSGSIARQASLTRLRRQSNRGGVQGPAAPDFQLVLIWLSIFCRNLWKFGLDFVINNPVGVVLIIS